MVELVVMPFKKLDGFVFPFEAQVIRFGRTLFTQGGLTDKAHHVFGLLVNFVLFVLPGIGQKLKNVQERRQIKPAFGREISAPIKRNSARSQKHIKRPSTLLAQSLNGLHVNAIDIGPFLAVYLDGYKAFIEHRRQDRIFKRFAFHHMAPVAGGVANAH